MSNTALQTTTALPPRRTAVNSVPVKAEGTESRSLKIGVLSLAHMFNDFYANYLPQMIPFLAISMTGFNATKATVLTATFTITSSLVQPIFGFWLDRHGKRWLVYVGTLWMAVMLSFTGLTDSYAVLVVLAALAGMGTAVFHPQASAMVNALSGFHKGIMMSVFVTAGNLGFALSPLLLIPLFQNFGLQATPFTVIPGVLAAVFLFIFAPRTALSKNNPTPLSKILKSVNEARSELFAIVGVIGIRSAAYTAVLTLLPLYFQS
jgi:FSR family fosmidomycin resistance protein-like MFS transporter